MAAVLALCLAAAALSSAGEPGGGGEAPTTPLPLGTASYWFVDDFALSSTANLSIETRRPSDPAGWRSVLTADQPWEVGPGCYIGGSSVVRLPTGRVRLYYSIRNCTGVAFAGFPKGDRWAVTGVAESDDGISFTKPMLHLASFRGAKATNLVAMADGTPCLYCDSVTIDLNAADAKGRYKSCTKNERTSEPEAEASGIPLKPGSLTCVQSADGLRWEVVGSMLIGSVDTQTNLLFDEQLRQYQLYTRLWWGSWRKPPLPTHHISTHRCVRRLVLNSTNFSSSDPALWIAANATSRGRILPGCVGHGCDANQTAVMCPDAVDWAAFPPVSDPSFPPLDYYGGTLWQLPAAEVWNTLIMFPMRHWHYSSECYEPPGQIAGSKQFGPHTKEAGVAVSRDRGGSFHYSDEPHRSTLLGMGMSGGNASRTTWIMPSPIRMNGQLLIYINGLNSDEVGGLDPLAQGHRHAGGTYVVVTRDAGLAALVPEGRRFGAKGEATTRPLLLPQEGVSSLTLNLDCGGGGYVQLGLLHANGTAIRGFELASSKWLAGVSSLAATAFWAHRPGVGVPAANDALGEARSGHEVVSSDLSKLDYDAAAGLRVQFVVKGCAVFAFQFRPCK